MNKESASRTHVLKHRDLLKKAALATYAFFRIAVTFFGITLASLYVLTPYVKAVLVPDFALIIFIIILVFLWASEILFRMAQYSSDVYCEDNPCDKNSDEEKVSRIMKFALNFPCRGMHLFLVGIWFILSLYYLIFSAVVISGGTTAMVYPANFLLSFYIVSSACALDFLAKGIFIFRLPAIGKFVTEVAVAVLQTNEGLPASLVAKALQLFFKK